MKNAVRPLVWLCAVFLCSCGSGVDEAGPGDAAYARDAGGRDDTGETPSDVGGTRDATSGDDGPAVADAGSDAMAEDAGFAEDGSTGQDGSLDDTGADAGSVDGGVNDTGPGDAGPVDSGSDDAGTDAGVDAGQDVGAIDTGSCPGVGVPADPGDAPLAGESPAGRTEATTVNGFHDEYLYTGADYVKVGVRREWGGSVIYFGLAGGTGPGVNNTNTIDANDTGREVQVAFYDPDRQMQNCAWNASCATVPTSCAPSITFLGWDPVQGGNRCNNGSGVDAVSGAGGVLSVTTTPLFWNPDWDRQDCSSSGCSDPQKKTRRGDVQVTQRIRFVRTHVAELDYTVINLSDLDHRETAQEMPTLYTANGKNGPDLWKLMDASGSEVPIDIPAGGDGFNYKNFVSPGGWVAMQNTDKTYGVGIYYENRLSNFQGWQLRSLPFNNVRAIFPFAIPAHGTVRARAYLILGAYGTVASEAGWLDGTIAPFGALDSPAADAQAKGLLQISGWALDNKGVTAVEASIDGGPATSLTYGGARPDVCLVWPQYAHCPGVGYAGTVDIAALTPCAHLLTITARDADGNAREIARRRFFVTP